MRVKGKQVVGAVVLAAVLTTAVVVTVEVTEQTSVRLPPKDAPPEQVLRVYLRAAKAHNCALTVALSEGPNMPDAAFCGGTSSNFFNNHPDLLSYKNVGDVEKIPPWEDGGIHEDCIQVDITETNMDDGGPDALPGWQFCLQHTSSGWRLTDEGYG